MWILISVTIWWKIENAGIGWECIGKIKGLRSEGNWVDDKESIGSAPLWFNIFRVLFYLRKYGASPSKSALLSSKSYEGLEWEV